MTANKNIMMLILFFILVFIFFYNCGYIHLFFQRPENSISIINFECNNDVTLCVSNGYQNINFNTLKSSNYTFYLTNPPISKSKLCDIMIDEYNLYDVGDKIERTNVGLYVNKINYCRCTEFNSKCIDIFPICTLSFSKLKYIPAYIKPKLKNTYNDSDGCEHKVYSYTDACTGDIKYGNMYGFGWVYYCSCDVRMWWDSPWYCYSDKCKSGTIDVGGKVYPEKPLYIEILNQSEAYKKYGLNYSISWWSDSYKMYRLYIRTDENKGYFNDKFIKNRKCIFEANVGNITINAYGKIVQQGSCLMCVLNESTFKPSIDIVSNILSEYTLKSDEFKIYWDFRPDSDGDWIVDEEDVCPNESGIELLKGCPPNDFDHDGMPDEWEIENGLDPLRNDSFLDFDSDGLSNIKEYELNTSVTNPDTDGDGILDGIEIQKGIDPNNEDTDGDGILDPVDKCPTEYGYPEYDGCVPWYEKYGVYLLVFVIIIIISAILYQKKHV